MTLRFKDRTFDKVAYKAKDVSKLAIPRDNGIRAIYIRPNVNITTGGVTAPVAKEDTLLNIIKKVRIVMDGDENKINVDLKKLFHVQKREKGGTEPKNDMTLPTTLATEKNLYCQIDLDFASNRQDRTDISALLPAGKFSSLDLEIEWGDENDLASTLNGMTLDTAKTFVEVELREVFDDAGVEAHEKFLNSPFIDIREGVDTIDITKAYTNFDDATLAHDIEPNPSKIITHLLVTEDDVGVRADDIITKLRVENTVGLGDKKIQRSWQMLVDSQKTEYGLETVDKGIAYIDWIETLGASLENFGKKGSLKYKFQTNAPVATKTDTIELFTRYIA